MHWWDYSRPQCPQHILLEAEAPCHKPHMRSVHLDQEQPVFHHTVNNEEMWQCFMALDSTPRNIYLTSNVFLIHFSCKLNVYWVSTFWFWAFQLYMCCYREKIIEVHLVYDYVCVHGMKSALEKRRRNLLCSCLWKPLSPPPCKHRAVDPSTTECIHWSSYYWMGKSRSNHCQFCSQQEASR